MTTTPMLEEKSLQLLRRGLQYIFSLKITASTFREVQNVIMISVDQNKTHAEALLQGFFNAKAPESVAKGSQLEFLQTIMDQFSVPILLAKEILEKGEFLNVITCDTLENNDKTLFLNRLRRVDGEEIHFLTDPNSFLHIVQHFVGRLHEFASSEKGKKALTPFKKQLDLVKTKIDAVAK